MGVTSSSDSRKKFEAETWLKMGQSHIQRGNLRQAALSFQKVLAIFPDHKEAQAHLEQIQGRKRVVEFQKEQARKKEKLEARSKKAHRKKDAEKRARDRQSLKQRVKHDFSLARPRPRSPQNFTEFKLNLEVRDTSRGTENLEPISGSTGEFMIQCPSCSYHSIYQVSKVKTRNRTGRLRGGIDCNHCSKSITVALKPCIHCQSGWSHYEEAPVYSKPHPFIPGARFEYRTGTFCPVCNPGLKEMVMRDGTLDMSRFQKFDFSDL